MPIYIGTTSTAALQTAPATPAPTSAQATARRRLMDVAGSDMATVRQAMTAGGSRPRTGSLPPTPAEAQAAMIRRNMAAAMQHVFRTFYDKPGNFKSTTKRTMSKPGDEFRIERANDEMVRLQNGRDDIERYKSGKAHNCYELAYLMHDALKSINIESKLVKIGDGSHVVLAVGSLPEGPVPADMADWPDDVQIGDPWSAVIGDKNSFKLMFELKMDDWAKPSRSKTVEFDKSKPEDEDQYGDEQAATMANDPAWLAEVLTSGVKEAFVPPLRR